MGGAFINVKVGACVFTCAHIFVFSISAQEATPRLHTEMLVLYLLLLRRRVFAF